MLLTKEETQEFKKLALEEYGVELTNEEAKSQGSRLIQLFELLLKNKVNLNLDTKLDLDDTKERSKNVPK